jgi:hypothetical protein
MFSVGELKYEYVGSCQDLACITSPLTLPTAPNVISDIEVIFKDGWLCYSVCVSIRYIMALPAELQRRWKVTKAAQNSQHDIKQSIGCHENISTKYRILDRLCCVSGEVRNEFIYVM